MTLLHCKGVIFFEDKNIEKNQQIKKRKKIVYEIMCCKEYQPMRAKELAVLLQIPAGKREELHKILDMLLEEGKSVSIKEADMKR